MSDNIKVVVKVRPLIQREISEKLSYQWRINNNTLYQIGQHGKETGQSFTFEKVYDQSTETKNVYDDVAKPIVEAAIAGINGTIFAYGQTSSGKTYTMSGSEDLPGIIQLAVYDLFNIIKNTPDRDFCVKASYIEIYNETLKDLLDVEQKNLKIKESFQGVKVNASEIEAKTPEEVLNIMKIGEANRHVGATNMNEESSRSHSIFQITITSKERIEEDDETGCVNMSQLNLVDLAGSERSGQTGATGQRFKEGTHINKSLSVLALVIKQLSEDPYRFINYRDSKLTRLLQNSLGGNAKTSIICAVTPAAIDETISTLQFANRAKAITNNPEVNAVVTDRTTIQTLTNQLARLQSQLEGKKYLEQDNYNLNKQIAALQRLITSDLMHRDSASNERRKCASRRATIAGHSFDAPDPLPFAAPSFRTPLLKYNINTTPFSMESTMSTSSRLPIVDEETISEHSTLKKQEKKINFSAEIITIDSDGEESIKSNDCSPNHKCYYNSKTPPCVLRKNVRLVEKELKDIIDFTELEKQYPPEVVELTRDLQVKRDTILQLEENINVLNEKDKDNKAKIEELIQKLEQSEQNVESITKTKDAINAELTTKITDLEVSYETLKKKANVREEELLSLIKEQQSVRTKSVESEKVNFLNISKDLSLVNTDSDDSFTSLTEPKKSHSDRRAEDVKSLEQLKKQIIVASREEIEMLKNENSSLKSDIEVSKSNVETLVNENISMRTEIEKLNASLNNQKESLHEEIEYYNRVICNLHGKLGDMQLIRIEEIFMQNLFNNRLNEFKTKFTEIVSKVNTLIEFNQKTCIDSANSIENLNKKIADLEIAIETKNQAIDELNIQIEDLIKQKSSLIKDNENVNSELKSKNEKLKELRLQLLESNSNYRQLRGEILSRDEQITSLKEKEKTICFEMKSLVLEKDTHISNIKLKLRDIQETLENETKSHNDVVKTKTNDIALLKHKLKNLEKLLDEKEDQLIDLTNNVYDSPEDSVVEVPLQLLTFVGDLITSLKQNMFYGHIDKKISHEEDETLSETVSQLREADDLITTSNITLNEKSGEIEKALERVKKFKDTMIKNENLYKEKIEELQIDNKALQTRFDELKKNLAKTKDCDVLKKSVEHLPHSLLSLCTNVINTFHFNKDNSEGIFNNRDLNSTYCQGEHQYTPEFYRQQISELNSTITELKFENSKLLDEQVMMGNEVQSLVESIKTLNKKILQHKTALSTKGATSFAENKLLKSQIRAAEHNYARIFSMINKDLPLLKEKLISLITLLHDDHPYDIGVTDLLACSLYGKSDTKNESTIDGDLLMLDTNITLTTVNDTLTNHDQTCFESTQILCDNEVVDESNQAGEINVGTCSETITVKYYDANDKIEMDIKNINESNRNEEFGSCKNCSRANELRSAHDKITKEMEQILKDQSEIKLQKNDIEKKYIAKTQEAGDLTEKLNNIVKECNHKSQEVENLKKSLNSKNNTLKELQVENDTLSTQLMENINEVEYAKKEIELLLEKNKKLKETCQNVMTVTSDKNHESGSPFNLHSKINRRHSDSASTSRCNKISTLRNELNAGRDVCKKLTENIASIKSELDHSAMNMDIISDAVGTENFDNGTNSSSLPNVPEESQDIYLLDKSLCSDYYIEKTGAQTKNICQDIKIVDIMKMLYTDITAKHSNEIENLKNKLKSDNEFIFLKIQLGELRSKLAEITRELEDKNIVVETTQNSLSALRKYTNDVKTNISKLNTNEHGQMTVMLNELLQKLDIEFDLSTSEIFEGISALLTKTQSGLIDSGEKYDSLLRLSETLNIEINDLKAKLNNKSSEYNTLETKLEKTNEIASAVTLDLIGRERLLHNVIVEKYKIMVEQNIVSSEEISLLPPLNTVVEKMLEKTLTALEAQKQAVENNNHLLEEISATAAMLKIEKEQLSEINVALSADAEETKSELLKQIRLHEELQELYTRKVQENESNIELLKQSKEKLEEIKQSFAEKEQSFNETVLATNVKVADLSKIIEELKLENDNLKTIYDVVKKEKESCGVELEKSCNTIKKHNDEIEKLTSDILVLRESIKDNCSVRENLKMEVKSLIEQNKSLKEQIEQRALESSRLEINIKTHEKSLQIQSGIILRLQKEKDESVKALVEKEKIIENLSKDCTTKQNELHILKTHNVELQNEIVGLQVQLGREPSKEEQPARPSLVCSRRRRQSCHDANRMLPTATPQEENKFEDKEDDESSRSTPIRFSLGRENTCKQEESPPPRPSSVKEIRKRRQSIHDHNRTVNVSHGPDNLNKSTIPDSDADLKELLVSYQNEIEELKQQNKELDEECETCATYLREREDQCCRLGKEKKDLQNEVTELKKQLRSYNPSEQSKLHDVAVNTDEDWTNLHSVVVDRLSYDVEVAKNKKLTRALDDFRVRNHELKAAVTKLQNKLQKNLTEGHTKTAKELEAVKLEVESCNQVISELRKRCKEMQADCETQNELIREKDKEIAILRDTSVALEAKMKEFNTQQQELHQMKLNMFQVTQQKALLEQQLISVTAAAPLYVAAGSAIVQNQQMSDIMKENQKLKSVNAKLMNICKKRTKANRENDEPSD